MEKGANSFLQAQLFWDTILLFTTPMGLSEIGQGMREGTRELRHTIRYEDGRTLLSHNRKSLGREGCRLTEYVNVTDAAFTVTVTCKITISKMQLLTRKKCLQTANYSLSCYLDRLLSRWAHPVVWLRKST